MQAPDGSFYGITPSGGSLGAGTVYHVDTNGTLNAIYSFDMTNGSSPSVVIMSKDGNLYGLTGYGGVGFDGTPNSGEGVAFKMTTNGDFTRLGSFTEPNAFPNCIVEGDDGNFYGTVGQGGTYGYGTIFRMTRDGQLSTLITFDGTNGESPRRIISASDGALYGCAGLGDVGFNGPYTGSGNVFRVSTNGDFTILHAFTSADGAEPMGSLLEVSNGVFYGVTYFGGLNGSGTIFQVSTDGDFSDLLNFDSTWAKSCFPITGLTKASDGNYYGITSHPRFEIFCLRPVEASAFQSSVQNGQISFSWNAWGGLAYQLRYKTNLDDPYWLSLSGSYSDTNSVGSYSEPVEPNMPRFYTLRINIRENWWGLPPLTGPFP